MFSKHSAEEDDRHRSTRGRYVGVLGIYTYFPPYYVTQEDLEASDGASVGKYTVGLGQEELCFGSDREDPVSMALTAVVRLMRSCTVAAHQIGRLDVGSESGVDRSKSLKSYLCEHFVRNGNTSVEGTDHVHGCYGATAALLDAVNWVEGSSWDGRLALVVATDVANYPPGSAAHPTGGAGATAMLVGPDAPLVLLPPPWRSTYAAHCFDFYKPVGSVDLFPEVDGPATKLWFAKAADACGALLHARLRAGGVNTSGGLLPLFGAYISHAPFNKQARKGLARLALQDLLRMDAAAPQRAQLPEAARKLDPDHLPDSCCDDKALEAALLAASADDYARLMADSAALQRRLGNQYAASVWTGLAALVEARGPALEGAKVALFSYGSGVQASLLVLAGRRGVAPFDLATMSAQVQASERLGARTRKAPVSYEDAIAAQHASYAAAPYTPVGEVADLAPGTAYLQHVDQRRRRHYAWTGWEGEGAGEGAAAGQGASVSSRVT